MEKRGKEGEEEIEKEGETKSWPHLRKNVMDERGLLCLKK